MPTAEQSRALRNILYVDQILTSPTTAEWGIFRDGELVAGPWIGRQDAEQELSTRWPTLHAIHDERAPA